MEAKYIKPDLVNPVIRQRIIKTIQPPGKTQWKPVKKFFSSLYEDYIIPNIYLVLFIIFVIFVLIYRYKITRDNRKKSSKESNSKLLDHLNAEITSPNNQQKEVVKDLINKKEINQIPDLAMLMYNQQKEHLREPMKRSKNFAYPVYPYNGPNGKFVISDGKSKN